jgi:hypothetical protein
MQGCILAWPFFCAMAGFGCLFSALTEGTKQMAKARAGYERLIYHGTAGSTAATQITHATDVNVNKTKERWETTDRGDGSAIPRKTEQVVGLVASITFNMVYHDSDSPLAAIIAVAESGGDIAVKVVRYTGGDTEFDGDVTIDMDNPGALKEGQVVAFTCFPTKDSGRTWTD